MAVEWFPSLQGRGLLRALVHDSGRKRLRTEATGLTRLDAAATQTSAKQQFDSTRFDTTRQEESASGRRGAVAVSHDDETDETEATTTTLTDMT